MIRQYAASQRIVQLSDNMSGYLSPTLWRDPFYNVVWNVDTASGFGLDIWGRIVGVSRYLTIPISNEYFGFENSSGTGFNQAPFFPGTQTTQTYALSDAQYRKLILAKAYSNISDCTIQSLNKILELLFSDRGPAFINDMGQMTVRLFFGFTLEAFEYAIITESNVFPRPAGVKYNITQVPGEVFGFKGSSGTGFNQAPFYNPEFSLTTVLYFDGSSFFDGAQSYDGTRI